LSGIAPTKGGFVQHMIRNGKNFSATLTAMALDAPQSKETTKNAAEIVTAIIKA
jgi:hypothetical protein